MNKRVLEVVIKVKDQASSGLDKFASKLGVSKGALAGMAAGAVVVIGVLKKMADALIQAVNAVITLGDSFDKMSKRTGESVDTLAQWVYSAELAGGSSRDIEIAFKKLAKSMYDAQQGLSTAVRAFDNLGIAVTDSNGELRDTNDVMLDLAEAFQHSTNRTETMAVAQDVLGRGALQMVAVLEQGKAALAAQGEEYGRLRGPMSDISTTSAEMVDSQLRLKTSWEGLKAELVDGLLPAFTDFNNGLAKTVGWVTRATESVENFFTMTVGEATGLEHSVTVMSDLEFHYMMLTVQAREATAALKDFSMVEFVDDEVIENAIAVNDEMALFNELMTETIELERQKAEALEKEAALREEVAATIETEAAKESELEEIVKSTGANFERLASNSISAMLQGTNGAIMFGRALRGVVMDAISAVIAKMLVLKAVSAFLGIITGGASSTIDPFVGGAASSATPNMSGIASAGGSLSAMSSASMIDPASIPSSGGGGASVTMNIARPIGILDVLDLGEAAVYSAGKLAEANL